MERLFIEAIKKFKREYKGKMMTKIWVAEAYSKYGKYDSATFYVQYQDKKTGAYAEEETRIDVYIEK